MRMNSLAATAPKLSSANRIEMTQKAGWRSW